MALRPVGKLLCSALLSRCEAVRLFGRFPYDSGWSLGPMAPSLALAPVQAPSQTAFPRFLVAAAAAVVAAAATAVVAAAAAATAVVAATAAPAVVAAAAANQEDQDDDPPAAPTETTIVTTTHDFVTSLRFSRSRRPARTPRPPRRRSRTPCARSWVILCGGWEVGSAPKRGKATERPDRFAA